MSPFCVFGCSALTIRSMASCIFLVNLLFAYKGERSKKKKTFLSETFQFNQKLPLWNALITWLGISFPTLIYFLGK